MDTHPKTTRNEQKSPRDFYNLNMTQTKHKTLTEGHRLENPERAQNTGKIPFSSLLLLQNAKPKVRHIESLSPEKFPVTDLPNTQKSARNPQTFDDRNACKDHEVLYGFTQGKQKLENTSFGKKANHCVHSSLNLSGLNSHEVDLKNQLSNRAGKSQEAAKTARECYEREERAFYIPFYSKKREKKTELFVNQTEVIGSQKLETFRVSHSLDTERDKLFEPKPPGSLKDLRLQTQLQTKQKRAKEIKTFDFEEGYFEQIAKNTKLEKEVLDLKKQLYESRESVKSHKKEKKDLVLLTKIKEEQQQTISNLEREKTEMTRLNTDLKDELESLRKQFQTKLLTFTNVISSLQEEIQVLQIQAKKNFENSRVCMEKKMQEENLSNRRGAGFEKTQHYEYNQAPSSNENDANACMEHQLSTKDGDQSQKSISKFVECVTDLVIECSPSNAFVGSRPTLKENWKWIKNMVKDYMVIKRKQAELNENEEISRACMDFLLVKEKKGIIPSLHQILVENKKLEQMVSRCRVLHGIGAQESYVKNP